MILSSTILLDPTGYPHAAIRELRDALTYKNPAYANARRLGFSTRYIPTHIKTYTEKGYLLEIARGEIRKVREILPGIRLDETGVIGDDTSISYVNDDFDIDTRQTKAIEAMMKKKQGIIHAATSAGKSEIILGFIGAIKKPTLIIVHRKVLLNQLLGDAVKRLRRGNVTPPLGIIGDGKCKIENVTFAIDKSLAKLLDKTPRALDRFGVVIADECHIAPSSTFQSIMNRLPAARRYGLTGTLTRKDQMEFLIFAAFGQVIATITGAELLDANRVSPVEVEVIPTEAVPPTTVQKKFMVRGQEVYRPVDFEDLTITERFQHLERHLSLNYERRSLIVETVEKILEDPTRKVMILFRLVEPCYDMKEWLEEEDIETHIVTGKEKDASRSCTEMERDIGGRVMVATVGCVSTGVNIPTLTDIILAAPIFNNEGLLHQIRGRLMRKAEGKTHGTIHLVWDGMCFPGRALSRFRGIMAK